MRRTAWIGVLVAAVGAAACEAMPSVEFDVWEATAESPVLFADVRDAAEVDARLDAAPGEPIANAIILLPRGDAPPDLDALAARLLDDPTVTERMHPARGSHGDGAFAMRTGADGSARFSELRLFPFIPARLERRFRVWAEGYEPRDVVIDVGTGAYRVGVPLMRSERR